MHPDWWTTDDGQPWLHIPRPERALEEDDILGRQVGGELTVIGPSWQVGHTLYTLLDHDAATGTRTLYALRSSGTAHRLMEGVHPEHLYGAWLLLTSPSAPAEPLGQLAFEYLLEESYTAAPPPLQNLDAIERRRYLQARDLEVWAREQGIVPTSPHPDPDVPDSLRLDPYMAEERAAVDGWLHDLQGELDLPQLPEQPDPMPADPQLEDAFDLAPPAGWTPQPFATMSDSDSWPGDATGPRPHGHRGDDDLTREQLRAEWAMWQADQRASAASSGAGGLLEEALAGRGPQSAALQRRHHRLATAAVWMRDAQDADAHQARVARDAAHLRQEADALAARALHPWWSVLPRGWWPPARRRRLQHLAEADRAHALALDAVAHAYGEDVLHCLGEARRAAPGSRDPVAEADLLEDALSRLQEEAVAADCLSAAQRRDELRREAQAARSLWWWHWHGAWHIREEIRLRSADGRRPPAPMASFGVPGVEDLRYCERPLRPGPGFTARPEDGGPW